MTFRFGEIAPIVGIGVGLVCSTGLGFVGVSITFFSLFAVLACGYIAGSRLVHGVSSLRSTFWGSLSALALLMLLRGAWFYAGGLLNPWANVWTITGMLVVTLVFILFVPQTDAVDVPTPTHKTLAEVAGIFVVIAASIAGLIVLAHAATQHATMNTIRTPWPLMPWWTLPLIGCLWALALAAAWRLRHTAVTYLQVVSALGAVTVIAPLLYLIGYGFDGFLHVAGERVLAETGTLFPKPPYYMGQYVLVTWIAQLFDLSIATVDRWLVPVAAAILIPAAALGVQKASADGSRASTNLLALVLLPFGAFVATTPHGFATVLGIVAVLQSEVWRDKDEVSKKVGAHAVRPYIVGIICAAWCALTHPLVGLPILCAVLAVAFWRGWMKWAIGIPLAVLAGPSVPLVFGAASRLGSSAAVQFSFEKFSDVNAWAAVIIPFIPWVFNRYAVWPQTAEWIVKLVPWMTCIFAILGAIHLIRTRHSPLTTHHSPLTTHNHWSIWLIASASTFLAAITLQLAGDFNFLIDYERGNYATRLFMVAGLLLLPVALPEFGRRLELAASAPFLNKLAVLLFIGIMGAGASYAALPRHDAVNTSRGWSVSAADVEAVKFIDQDANGSPYTVLANQSVSAAAVSMFGFKRYHNDVFYYPIPTGGPLYNTFLWASYEDPSRETMREAARLGGSDLVYFVVNDYWWDATELMDAAASSTNRTFDIQQGKVKVFKYDLKTVIPTEAAR